MTQKCWGCWNIRLKAKQPEAMLTTMLMSILLWLLLPPKRNSQPVHSYPYHLHASSISATSTSSEATMTAIIPEKEGQGATPSGRLRGLMWAGESGGGCNGAGEGAASLFRNCSQEGCLVPTRTQRVKDSCNRESLWIVGEAKPVTKPHLDCSEDE